MSDPKPKRADAVGDNPAGTDSEPITVTIHVPLPEGEALELLKAAYPPGVSMEATQEVKCDWYRTGRFRFQLRNPKTGEWGPGGTWLREGDIDDKILDRLTRAFMDLTSISASCLQSAAVQSCLTDDEVNELDRLNREGKHEEAHVSRVMGALERAHRSKPGEGEGN